MMSHPEENRLALVILGGFFMGRLFFAFTVGLGIDESYTIAISRRLVSPSACFVDGLSFL